MSRRPRPILYVKEGDILRPHPRFMKLFHEQFAEGEEVPLDIVQARSMASHNHYFASLNEAYLNLPEEYTHDITSAEHLRFWCLCKEGFCTISRYVMNTADDARTSRAVLKKEKADTIVRVDGNVMTVFTPFSQSLRAMGKDQFEASKKAVLARAASMARTTAAELNKNAGRSA